MELITKKCSFLINFPQKNVNEEENLITKNIYNYVLRV